MRDSARWARVCGVSGWKTGPPSVESMAMSVSVGAVRDVLGSAVVGFVEMMTSSSAAVKESEQASNRGIGRRTLRRIMESLFFGEFFGIAQERCGRRHVGDDWIGERTVVGV